MKDKADGLFYRQDEKWVEFFYLVAIAMINRSLQDPENATTDTMVLSVLILAGLATSDDLALEIMLTRDSPFDSPFPSLQWVDVYSLLPHNPIHLEGLIKIIDLKGGIENIKLPYLAGIISSQVLDLSLRRSVLMFASVQVRHSSFDSMAIPSTLPIHLHTGDYLAENG
jgi:hypothetical protein